MNSHRSDWKNGCYPALAVLLGLLTAQLIATVQVSVGNHALYQKLRSVSEMGYFTVPNQTTLEHLRYLSTAVYGGLFFALTTGAGMSALSFAAAWLWDRVCFPISISLFPGYSAGGIYRHMQMDAEESARKGMADRHISCAPAGGIAGISMGNPNEGWHFHQHSRPAAAHKLGRRRHCEFLLPIHALPG